ncbi:MAG: D-glycero-beta-D-manno-heptose 1,7-bisphosphate 7-phosphatase [Methylotetracoccus sp.]|jgi:D-glycero-D-manno-heptose 1,7-bisphosphate phosphatase|nr:D-glycero-beta-D-manno-heptose 1,7-bisphosphate 7-phosphatase [Methylotetracoccus sp.]
MSFVLLDRDGVINRDADSFIKCPEEWEPLPGSLEAIALLTGSGFRIVVLSNQSGIARGLFDLAMLDRIHDTMCARVAEAGGAVEAIYCCPHGPGDHCDCRKPKPGLFHRFAREFSTPLEGVPAIGDSLRDLQAARTVGAAPMLVRTGKGEGTLRHNPKLAVPVFANLYEAALFILDRYR